ncbi:hypothetical protein CLOP_g21118, partial [Closterium sp. NIES-67]
LGTVAEIKSYNISEFRDIPTATLDGSNYEEWSGRMRSAFKRYKLLKIAVGEEKMPEEGEARERWIEKNAVLFDLILQSVNKEMFEHIKDLVEADDSGDDVKPVLDKIKDTYARMAAAGSSVSQLQQCTKIISVLDNSWDNLIPTLNSQQDQWTPEWLRQQILQEDFRRRHVGGGAATKTAEGYGAAGRGKGRGGWRGRGRGRSFGRGRGRGDYNEGHGSSSGRGSTRMEGTCWYCKKIGHPWFNCIKDLWQLPIIPWNGKTPTAAMAAAAKATAGGDATAPTDGVLEAVKKVQQQQTHGEVLAGVDASAAWAKASSKSGEADWETWHERLCHVNFPMLQKLVKDGSLKGLEVKGGVKEIGSCPTCLETKFSKFPFNSTTGPAKAPLALVHMDVVGPTRAPSLSGSRYFLTIVDDHTRADEVQQPSRQVEVAVSEEEMSGVTEEGGAAEVEQQQQQQQQHESPPRVPHPPERPRRDVRPPVRLTYGGRGKPNVVQAGSVVEQIEEDEIAHCYWAPIPEPKTREEALNGPNGEKWKASEDEEFGSLIENETWDLLKADGTSIGGYVCLLGGGAVSWRSKKQNEMGLSSCETEYMALHHGAKEVVWLRRLLEELGVGQEEPTVVFCDNEFAVKLAKNACLHGLTKHIRPKWHWCVESHSVADASSINVIQIGNGS